MPGAGERQGGGNMSEAAILGTKLLVAFEVRQSGIENRRVMCDSHDGRYETCCIL